MYLKKEVVSSRKEVYASVGDSVKVISLSGEVAIVEDEKGNRFATRFENLSENKVEKIIVANKK